MLHAVYDLVLHHCDPLISCVAVHTAACAQRPSASDRQTTFLPGLNRVCRERPYHCHITTSPPRAKNTNIYSLFHFYAAPIFIMVT